MPKARQADMCSDLRPGGYSSPDEILKKRLLVQAGEDHYLVIFSKGG